jgi:hypothetical protein
MGVGLESCCVNRAYAAALKTTTHPKTQSRKPYGATQHLMLLMMGVCTQTCRVKNTSINYVVASSWHFTLFHEEDARSYNPHGWYSVNICLQRTWLNSKILTWDAYASQSLLTDFTSLYCLHHIMSYYFHTLLSTNIYIYTDKPWLILGFWRPVCKVVTSFKNNLYMYTNSPLVQQYRSACIRHTNRITYAASYYN